MTDLVGYYITMTLKHLLWLVLRFSKALKKLLQLAPAVEVQVASRKMGSNMIDPHFLGVDILLHGRKITQALIDGGSGVNVITTVTAKSSD